MKIRYLSVRPSKMTPKLSNFAASHITAAVYRKNQKLLKFGVRDILSIFFEQALLTDYLLAADPNNRALLDYQSTLRSNLQKYQDEDFDVSGTTDEAQVTSADQELIAKYVYTGKLPGMNITALVDSFMGAKNSKYCTVPRNFSIPYLQVKENSFNILNPDGKFLVPIVLSPVLRRDKTSKTDVAVTFFARSYSSMQSVDSYHTTNPTHKYICSMNYNGHTWHELVDTLQSLFVDDLKQRGSESLCGVLKNYFHRNSLGMSVNTKMYSTEMLNMLRALTAKYPSLIEKEPVQLSQFGDLFSYLNDNRLNYLTNTNPTMGQVEKWEDQGDLRFLSSLSLVGYGMEAADSSESSSDDDDETKAADDTTTTESEGDNPDDTSSDDTEDDGGADPFATDDFSSDPDGSDDSEGDGSSSSTDTTSDDTTVDPEDVNPLIELIDDESFDEYLERGTLQNRINRLINNPPSTIQLEDVEFLKFWVTQWFSLVSVATTKEILGDILGLSD